MAFAYNSTINKSLYALFMRYSHATENLTTANYKLLGKQFLAKSNREDNHILLDDITLLVEASNLPTDALYSTISSNDGTRNAALTLTIPDALVNATSRVFYIHNNLPVAGAFNDIEIKNESAESLYTLNPGHTIVLVFAEDDSLSFYVVDSDTSFVILYPMGVISADSFSLKTENGDELVTIEGDSMLMSKNVVIEFALSNLWDEKLMAGDDVARDFSTINDVEILLYDKTKEEIILVKNLIKHKTINATGNAVGQTIFTVKKEVTPEVTDLTYA